MKFLAVHLTTRETSLSQEAKTIPAVFGDERKKCRLKDKRLRKKLLSKDQFLKANYLIVHCVIYEFEIVYIVIK